MATLTLKNIPEGLHARLRQSAEKNRRSLNGEILARLSRQEESQSLKQRRRQYVALAQERDVGDNLKGVPPQRLHCLQYVVDEDVAVHRRCRKCITCHHHY